MRITLAILLFPLVALGQFTVTVTSNGVLRSPTNFFAANSNALVAVSGTGGGGGTGTVTSVGLTVPSGFSVTGSPVTGSGTLAITGVLATSAGGTGISGTTAAGQALLAAVDAAAQRTALGLGSAATNNVPASGDAATNQVVLGSDSRLTDARTPTSHNHAASEITSGVLSTARLGTGTGTSSNFLRGDGSFSQVSTGDVQGLVSALASLASTGLVSSAASGLAPQATVPDAQLSTDSDTNVAWMSRWMPVTTISGTSHTLALTNAGQYLRLTSASSCAITVPAGTNVPFTLGAEIVLRVAAAGIPTMIPQGGVTLNGTNVLSVLSQHSTLGIKLVVSTSTNWVWDIL